MWISTSSEFTLWYGLGTFCDFFRKNTLKRELRGWVAWTVGRVKRGRAE